MRRSPSASIDGQRESETSQQLYDTVAKRLKETGVTGGLETKLDDGDQVVVLPAVAGGAGGPR